MYTDVCHTFSLPFITCLSWYMVFTLLPFVFGDFFFSLFPFYSSPSFSLFHFVCDSINSVCLFLYSPLPLSLSLYIYISIYLTLCLSIYPPLSFSIYAKPKYSSDICKGKTRAKRFFNLFIDCLF